MSVYKRIDSKYWWLRLESAPKGRQRFPTKVLIGDRTQETASRKIAEKVYFAKMGELALEVHGLPVVKEATTFNTFADWHDEHVISTHRGATREREILKQLRKTFGPLDLRAIDKDKVIEWHTARSKVVSVSTANRELDVLKMILRDATPKYIPASPIAGMKRLTGKKPKRRLLSPDEEARLLKVATDPQDYAIIVVGQDTLMRLGDLLALKRSDRKGVWLYVAHPKGGEPYEVPLSPRAGAALDAIPRERGEENEDGAQKTGPARADYFFSKFRKAENPRDWRGSVRQRLEFLCAQAEPPVPFGKEQGGITFHWATRRTGATRLLVDKNKPVTVVQTLGNWKTPDVLLEIYAEAQRADLLDAVGSLSRKKDRPSRK